jgi:hypothetical protein
MINNDHESEFDARPSIRLDNSILENRKVVGLTDKAFRSYIAALCYCSRQETDGRIVAGARKVIGSPKVVIELLKAGLFEEHGEDLYVHDYLKHQRSSAEIDAFRKSRSQDGKFGAHLRWHVPRRQKVKDCDYCQQGVTSA